VFNNQLNQKLKLIVEGLGVALGRT